DKDIKLATQLTIENSGYLIDSGGENGLRAALENVGILYAEQVEFPDPIEEIIKDQSLLLEDQIKQYVKNPHHTSKNFDEIIAPSRAKFTSLDKEEKREKEEFKGKKLVDEAEKKEEEKKKQEAQAKIQEKADEK